MLPLIVFAILVGAVGTQLTAEKQKRLQAGLELVAELMTGIVHFALRLAPYAVPAMIYSVVVKVGVDILVALGVFVLGSVFVLLLHLFGTMSVLLKLWSRRSPLAFFATSRRCSSRRSRRVRATRRCRPRSTAHGIRCACVHRPRVSCCRSVRR